MRYSLSVRNRVARDGVAHCQKFREEGSRCEATLQNTAAWEAGGWTAEKSTQVTANA